MRNIDPLPDGSVPSKEIVPLMIYLKLLDSHFFIQNGVDIPLASSLFFSLTNHPVFYLFTEPLLVFVLSTNYDVSADFRRNQRSI